MKFGVIRFPGTCDDVDAQLAAQRVAEAELLWHRDRDLKGVDAVVVPGGFSYGDYLRAGAIARFAPVMESVIEFAHEGGLVLGICNGFQILCDAGCCRARCCQRPRSVRLPPGDAGRSRTRHALHPQVRRRAALDPGQAHDRPLLLAASLTSRSRQGGVLRYAPGQNPNGSQDDIAGVVNKAGNVFGLMPHPEHAVDPLTGSADGLTIFESIAAACERVDA